MQREDNIVPRRAIMVGGLAMLAGSASTAASPARPRVEPHSAAERSNIQLMMSFWADWGADDLDIDALVKRYMAPHAAVRWSDDTPVHTGWAAAAAAAKSSMPKGSRAVIRVHETFAHGPMVANSRTDIVQVPGLPDAVFNAAGVAFVVNGKIVEYTDYVVR